MAFAAAGRDLGALAAEHQLALKRPAGVAACFKMIGRRAFNSPIYRLRRRRVRGTARAVRALGCPLSLEGSLGSCESRFARGGDQAAALSSDLHVESDVIL